jgi:hypothetical protein
LAQQGIGRLTALPGCEVVGFVEEAIVDCIGLDEIEDLDALGFLERRGGEVLFGQHHESSLLVLVALDEILPGHFLPVLLAHPLEIDRRAILGVQHSKMRPVLANRRVHLDRNVHETEGKRTAPDCSRHFVVPRSGPAEAGRYDCNVSVRPQPDG